MCNSLSFFLEADPWNTYVWMARLLRIEPDQGIGALSRQDEPEPQWDMPDTSAVNDGGSADLTISARSIHEAAKPLLTEWLIK